MPLALDKAELIALFVECILYGIFCVSFLACIYILVFHRSTDRPNYPMVITAVTLWCLSTAHVSIDLRRVLMAFYYRRDSPGGPIGFFSVVSDITHILKSAIYITHTCVSDCLVIYRTYIVLRSKTLTSFLVLMLLGTAVSGYGSIYVLVHMDALTGSIFATSLAPWITAFNVITAATNVIATAFIASRIWWVNRRAGHVAHGRSLHPIIALVIESGVIYAFALLLLTGFYTSDNNAQFVVLDAITPLIGIVFTLIIIRVGLNLSHTGSRTHTSSNWRVGQASAAQVGTHSSALSPSHDSFMANRAPPGRYQLQPMTVKISTTFESDLDGRLDDVHSGSDEQNKESARWEPATAV